MIYADERYYEEKYLLGRKPVIGTDFEFYARQASQMIDRYTYGRLKEMKEVTEAVQMCCCELAEAQYNKERKDAEIGSKAAEKIGTYSVSFNSPKEYSDVFVDEQRNIIMKWLSNTGLCYKGV